MTRRIPYQVIEGLPVHAQQQLRRDFQEIEKGLNATSGQTIYDAIIDPDLTADSSSTRQFKTVYAALSYLSSLGYSSRQSVHLGLTGRASASLSWWSLPTTASVVTETNTIPDAFLPPGGLAITGMRTQEACVWDLNTRTIGNTSGCNLYLRNLVVKTTAGTIDPTLGNDVYAVDVHFYGAQAAGTTDNCAFWGGAASQSIFHHCFFDGARPGANQTYCFDCSISANTGSTLTIGQGSANGSVLVWIGGSFGAAGSTTYKTAAKGVHIDTATNFPLAGPNGQVTINPTGGGHIFISVTSDYNVTAPPILIIPTAVFLHVEGGPYEKLTYVAGNGNQTTCTINADFMGSTATTGLLDITGPALINVNCNALIVRGDWVVGSAVVNCIGAGTAVVFNAAVFCNLQVAGQQVTGIRQSYNLNATSNNNILTFAGATGFTTAGVNAGAGNVITAT